MTCQRLFSGKNRKNIINLSCAELAQRVVKIKTKEGNQRLNPNVEQKILSCVIIIIMNIQTLELPYIALMCPTSSLQYKLNKSLLIHVIFFFFFDLGFTALSRIFHLYRADRSSKVGENRSTRRKTT